MTISVLVLLGVCECSKLKMMIAYIIDQVWHGLITRKCMNMSGCHFQYSICALNNRVIQNSYKMFWREIELYFGSMYVCLSVCCCFLEPCKTMSEKMVQNFQLSLLLFVLSSNDSIFLSQTAKHVMSNPAKCTISIQKLGSCWVF